MASTLDGSRPRPQRAPRPSLPFAEVNRKDGPGYDGGFQRHHLLPLQLVGARCFGVMFDSLGRERIGFDDFRSNGLLLPAVEAAVLRLGLPLHRGPHHRYNAVVIARVGQIEAQWSACHPHWPELARDEALMRLALLQRALRRRLLDPPRRRFSLHRRDPLGTGLDFTELDAMADTLWLATEVAS